MVLFFQVLSRDHVLRLALRALIAIADQCRFLPRKELRTQRIRGIGSDAFLDLHFLDSSQNVFLADVYKVLDLVLGLQHLVRHLGG